MINPEDKQYVYKSTLRAVYGLTDKMIAQLGEPDKVVKNPHYKRTSASLFLIERVERWIDEHQAEVDKAKALRPARSARAKVQYEARRQMLIDWATNVPIAVMWPDDFLAACEAHYAETGYFEDTYRVSQGAVLAYARHNCTNYHALLNQLGRRMEPGADEAYGIIKNRVNQACQDRMHTNQDE